MRQDEWTLDFDAIREGDIVARVSYGSSEGAQCHLDVVERLTKSQMIQSHS